MTDHTPTPGAALAVPCKHCRTTDGYRAPDCHRPRRTRGYCHKCYTRARKLGFPATLPARISLLVAHICVGCGSTFHAYASHGRRSCSHACFERHQWGESPANLPTGTITPAMLGCTPGQPPTDPGCTPDRVWEIANTNTRRALAWLARHTDLPEAERLALAVWYPAREDPQPLRAVA